MTYKSVFDHSGQELSLKECLGGGGWNIFKVLAGEGSGQPEFS